GRLELARPDEALPTLVGVLLPAGLRGIVVVATGIYTVFGGLRAVLYTDLLQMFVLVAGAGTVTIIGLGAVGGWDVMVETAGSGFFTLWKPMSDPDFPWTGILLGAPILGVWYWCTDQFIVQRVLAARDETQARRGTIFAGFLKLLPLFIFVIPGVIAYALVEQGRLELARPDEALPTLVGVLLPAGLRGIVVAGLLAALMSSLSSVFNSCSTLITWDVYRELHPGASERRLVWVGQLSTAVLVGFGLLWIPLMELISGQLYTYIQSVQAYISPPIAAVFLFGVFWSRLNARGAMASLITGFVLGMGRLVAELNQAALDGWLLAFARVNFLHFAVGLFLVCSAVLVLASLTAPPPPADKVAGLTYGTAVRREPRETASRRRDAILSVILAVAVGAVWLYFS
ncbi:MAG TPA: sodium/solute symporter, partial [Gemmatimonadota bacterium]|nr:sodium/solute symporter [Gemmatimonadota bacterium]